MGKFIAVHILKQYNPGNFNRGEDGEAKQIIIGGTPRVRFSSQCQKRVIRELMACEEIRTAHIEKLISKCLDIYVENKTITEEEKDIIGNAICSKEVIGTKCWDKLKKNKENINTDLKGNVIVTTNASEITSLVDTFVDKFKELGQDEFEKNYKKIAEETALSDVSISIAKSLFGTMATDGVLGTVNGAVQMGQAFSVDEYIPESDFFTMKFVGRSGADKTDPFFGAYTDFNDIESKKAASETINTGLSLYSNLMYTYANVNLLELERNLNSFISPRQYIPNESTKNIIKDIVPKFIQSMIEMVPEATQNRSSSHIMPCAVLIEVIDDGSNLQPDWSKVIKPKYEESISDQAIKKLANFSTDMTFRSGEIKSYVMLNNDNKYFTANFSNSILIKNFKDLNSVLKNDIENLIKDL